MKAAELRQHQTCGLCHKKVLHTGLPLFWRVTVERFGVDMRAVLRADGLAAMLGSGALAAAMGPDEDLATPVGEPSVLAVCEHCATSLSLPVAVLAESAG
jgi:hypothetical protein